MIKKVICVFFLINFSNDLFTQNDYRTWIKGKVLYKNVNVSSANVINNSSQKATTTNQDGEFDIEVKLNDKLIFSSVQYQITELNITKEILQKNRIVIDVNEKVTELDEVVVTPDDKEKFLVEIKKLSSSNDFYLHSDEDGEIALNTSLIQAIEFNDEDDNKRGAGLVSSD